MTSVLFRHGRQALISAALLAACAAASAAQISFTGQTDAIGPPPAGTTFSGSFSYDDALVPADGSLALTAFTLNFFGQTYNLADADSAPQAVFAGGNFVGVDFFDIDSPNPTVRPWVQLVAGFDDLRDAHFSYDLGTGDLGSRGFGSFNGFTPINDVPEPASMALSLAALLLLGGCAAARRRG